jgi:hypothetical protein
LGVLLLIAMLMNAIQLPAFYLDLDKVNVDGPSMKLEAGFSVSLYERHDTFYQIDAMEDQSEASVG